MLERVLVTEDPEKMPMRLRVTETFEETGLLDIVEALMTSHAATARELEVETKLVLTRDEVRWLRDVLSEALGDTASHGDVGQHIAIEIKRDVLSRLPPGEQVDPKQLAEWATIANGIIATAVRAAARLQ